MQRVGYMDPRHLYMSVEYPQPVTSPLLSTVYRSLRCDDNFYARNCNRSLARCTTARWVYIIVQSSFFLFAIGMPISSKVVAPARRLEVCEMDVFVEGAT